MTSDYESCIRQLEQYATRTGLTELRLAREEFHTLTGEFAEGEPWFETRATMFLDWYLLDRVSTNGTTPNEQFIAENAASLDADVLAQHRDLDVTLRSTFRIEKLKGDRLTLLDMTGGGRWSARWTKPAIGLLHGDILDARLVRSSGSLIAGRGAVLHPKEAHESIERIIARALSMNMPRRLITDHLDKMRLKLDRYSNVKIRHVYQYPDDAVM